MGKEPKPGAAERKGERQTLRNDSSLVSWPQRGVGRKRRGKQSCGIVFIVV